MPARKHIYIRNNLQASNFSRKMQTYKTTDTFVLENEDGSDSVNPSSYLGVLYMSTYCPEEIYLTNLTSDSFPDFTEEYC